MKPRFVFPALLSLAAGVGALLALSNCKQETYFEPYIREICTDRVDNDEDGKLDCDDGDCQGECSVDISIITPSPTAIDSLEIAGTSRNAKSVSILVSPAPGLSRTATVDPSTGDWTAMLYDLKTPQVYTVKAIATSPQNAHDTAVTTVERRP